MKNFQITLAAFGMASLTLAGIAFADEVTKEGYAIDSNGKLIKNSYNECLKSGHWTPAMAILECDPDLVKKKEEPQKAEAVPSPVEPAPRLPLSTMSLFSCQLPCKQKNFLNLISLL